MAIGIQQSASQLNSMLASYVAQMNNLTANIVQLQDYVVFTGVAGLEALPNPFTAADAASYIQAVNYMNTVAQLWLGAAAQPTAYNFQNQMAQLLGPTPA